MYRLGTACAEGTYMRRSRFALALPLSLCLVLLACAASDPDDVADDNASSANAVTSQRSVGDKLVTTGRLNFRASPSTAARVLRVFASGTEVTVVAGTPQNGFYQVSEGGEEGWASGMYLRAQGSSSSSGSSSGGGNYGTTRSIDLKYQGSCDFLHRCDSYSRGLPAGQVEWGCLGHADRCIDSEHWASGPSRAYCGKTVRFCKGATCTTAVIKDVSVTQDFEASQGVLSSLGIGFGGGSTCSNTYVNGSGRVMVSY
jgi:uncharacterized protein YraI